MSTTNGTRATVAARGAKLLLVGALVNAAAVGRRLVEVGLDITLLCAGTDGDVAMEDLIGAGAVMDAMPRDVEIVGDPARIALRMFRGCRADPRAALLDAQGGRNVLAAALPEDIAFAARLNAFDVVGRVLDEPLRVVPW
jgi:2-phosphosulfolactate phosphatase